MDKIDKRHEYQRQWRLKNKNRFEFFGADFVAYYDERKKAWYLKNKDTEKYKQQKKNF